MKPNGTLESADYNSPLFGACLIAHVMSDSSDVPQADRVLDRAESLYLAVQIRGGFEPKDE